jgi:transposase-like protein
MLGFKSVTTAAVTITGIELAHRISKRQFLCQPTDQREPMSQDSLAAVILATEA